LQTVCPAQAFVRTIRGMKRTLLTTVTAALLLAVVGPAARATEVGYSRKFGLGIQLGDPTGLSAKLWVSPTNALDFGLGFQTYGYGTCYTDSNGNQVCGNFGHDNGSFNMDYLWQSNIIRGTAQLDWHIGGGGRLIWWGGCQNNCVAVAARAPIGLDLMFTNPNFIEVFFELAPSIWLVPGIDFGIDGDLGARFYF
jgi:hypothetical protein